VSTQRPTDYKMKAVSARLRMNPETLHKWVRQGEVDAGEAPEVRTGAPPVRSASCAASAGSWSPRNIQGRNEFLRAGVLPATPLICQFIDEHRSVYRVVPILIRRTLAVHGVQIAPRTY
jgi:hypothetical protein